MKPFIFLFCIVLPAFQLKGQVEKMIFVESLPVGAVLTQASGKAVTIGKTPGSYLFNFHSEISILKLKLSACGYYDTVFSISPGVDTLRIDLERKKFYIMPESVADTVPQRELKNYLQVLNDFLREFSSNNISKPVNFADFAILKRSDKQNSLSLTFEVDPAYLNLPRTIGSDSLMIKYWNDLFAPSFVILNRKYNLFAAGTVIYFSVIAGKKNMSVRHVPGVDVSDELRSETSVYEDDYKRVTTTTFYYETVTNPTFNTSVSQTQKYTEILYHVVPGKDGRSFSLAGTAAMNVTNGRMSVLFESQAGLSSSSMLTRFMSSDKK